MTSPTLSLAGRAAMLPSSRADPDHGRRDPEPARQRVVARRGGRNTWVFSFPLAQPQRCCCCGLDTCLQLCPAPTFAKPRELKNAGHQLRARHCGQQVQIPQPTRAHAAGTPTRRTGPTRVAYPAQRVGICRQMVPRWWGEAGKSHACARSGVCRLPACSAPLRSALLLRGTCNYPDQAPCHSSARGVESSRRQ